MKRLNIKKKRFRFIGDKVSNGNKNLDNLIGFLFILGLTLLVWEIYIYRKTVIDLKIPLIIWLTPGVILTPILYHKMNNIDGTKAHWILHYFLHTGMTGAFILFGFMATNFYFSDNLNVNKKFEILEKGSLSGSKGSRNKRKPYVIIDYEGLEKQLVFSNSKTAKVNSGKYVKVNVKNGLWGFDILETYDIE